jgi:putative superfamily III holin-X
MAAHVEHPGIGELIKHIGDDVKTIASDELEMGRNALVNRLESIVIKAGLGLLGAAVVLVGLGMLCLTVVFALQPVIAALWLRMLIMSIVYLAIGAAAVTYAAKRIGVRDVGDLDNQIKEAGDTIDAVKNGLAH